MCRAGPGPPPLEPFAFTDINVPVSYIYVHAQCAVHPDMQSTAQSCSRIALLLRHTAATFVETPPLITTARTSARNTAACSCSYTIGCSATDSASRMSPIMQSMGTQTTLLCAAVYCSSLQALQECQVQVVAMRLSQNAQLCRSLHFKLNVLQSESNQFRRQKRLVRPYPAPEENIAEA